MDEIEILMDDIHAAIVSGKTKEIPEIGARLENALAHLQKQPTADNLTRLRNKAARNQVLLAAAGQGIRAAMRRIEEVRQAQLGSEFYDVTGQRHIIAPNKDQLSRRL